MREGKSKLWESAISAEFQPARCLIIMLGHINQVEVGPMGSLLSPFLSCFFILLLIGRTIACPHNCDTCEGSNCSVCSSSFYLLNTDCQPCPRYCTNCTDQNICTSCSVGYIISQDQLCIATACNPNICASCTDRTVCETCQSGYVLDGSICIASTAVQANKSSWIWIVAICFGCLVMLMVMLFCCRIKRTSAQSQEEEGQIPSAMNIASARGGNGANELDNIEVRIGRNVDVRWEIYLGEKNTNENCAICLEDKTTCITFCMHRFHEECLLIWLRKDKKCPLCRKEHVHPVSYFCSSCYDQCFTVQQNSIMKRSNEEQRCDSCKVINL